MKNYANNKAVIKNVFEKRIVFFKKTLNEEKVLKQYPSTNHAAKLKC